MLGGRELAARECDRLENGGKLLKQDSGDGPVGRVGLEDERLGEIGKRQDWRCRERVFQRCETLECVFVPFARLLARARHLVELKRDPAVVGNERAVVVHGAKETVELGCCRWWLDA